MIGLAVSLAILSARLAMLFATVPRSLFDDQSRD
jgi:hypothetical protein